MQNLVYILEQGQKIYSKDILKDAKQGINLAAFRTDLVHCEMAGVEQKELSKLIENPSILRPKGDQTRPTATIHSTGNCIEITSSWPTIC